MKGAYSPSGSFVAPVLVVVGESLFGGGNGVSGECMYVCTVRKGRGGDGELYWILCLEAIPSVYPANFLYLQETRYVENDAILPTHTCAEKLLISVTARHEVGLGCIPIFAHTLY